MSGGAVLSHDPPGDGSAEAGSVRREPWPAFVLLLGRKDVWKNNR